MEATHTGVRILDSDIGVIRAEVLFRLYDAQYWLQRDPSRRITVSFENGPAPAEYTEDKLRHLLDLMDGSCGEYDVLIDLDIDESYPALDHGYAWKNVVLFDGNGKLIFGPISLSEQNLCQIASNLHNECEDKEIHCIIVVKAANLPDGWDDEKIEKRHLLRNASCLIRRQEIMLLSALHLEIVRYRFGKITMTLHNGQVLDPESINSTRLRPPLAG